MGAEDGEAAFLTSLAVRGLSAVRMKGTNGTDSLAGPLGDTAELTL